MALYSAGVEVKEIDLTNIVPALATSVGGYAGSFNWGPAGQLVTVSSEKDLVTNFGPPNNVTTSTTASFFTAASFLKYGSNLKVSRSVETADYNAATKPWQATGAITTLTAAPTAAGTGYAVGDILTLSGGTAGNLATAQVLTISGGAATGPVATVALLYSGAGYTATTGIVTTGGTGTSCTLAVSAIATNGYAAVTSTRINNKDVFDATVSGTVLKSAIVARYPGVLGNALSVVLCRSTALTPATTGQTDGTQRNDMSSYFSYVPGKSSYSEKIQTANGWSAKEFNDEIHIAVIDSDGSFTGTAGTILEKWEGLSLFTDAKTDNGATNYYRDVVNRNSNYIYINKLMYTRNTTVAGSASLLTEAEFTRTDGSAFSAGTVATQLSARSAVGGGVIITLESGTNAAMTATGMSTAYDLFTDAQSVDVNLLFGEVHAVTSTAVTNDIKLATIVNSRKDCVGFISAPLDVANKTTDATKKSTILTDKLTTNACPVSSYIVMDSSPVYVYNKYNDNYLWIPACGHIAGLCANTDEVADAWFSPAGFNRGQLQDVVKLAYNPNQADRDDLYKVGVNPICAFPGQGIVLYGDKTRLAKPSAFDRINVRRLFITLEKSISTASKYQLFEQNDDFTRAAFKNMVEPYLRDVKGRRGITDFRVVCDSTNNSGDVVDGNRFVADIYIKPTRSINFITLNFIATRTGVEFKTIVGA
jgi:hypothetical protein